MRLVCPKCDAKYEVPEDAIPETGRDVQCANCGHAWYQMRTRAAGTEPALSTAPAPVAPVPAPEPEPEPEPEPAAEPPAAVAEPDPIPEPDPMPAPEPPVAPEPVDEASAGPAEPAAPEAQAGPFIGEAEAREAEAAPQPEAAAEDSAADPVSAEARSDETAPEAEAVATGPLAETVSDAGSGHDTAAVEVTPEPKAEPQAETPLADTPLAEAPVAEAVVTEAAPAMVAEVEPQPVADDSPSASDGVRSDASDPDDTDEAAAPAPAVAAASAYAVDESVLAILREEAEREAEARRAEARPLETQPDLGVDTAVLPVPKPGDLAQGFDPASGDGETGTKPTQRRGLLPDVEEINSTLRPSEAVVEPGIEAEPSLPAPAESSSFRSGFLLVMTVAILAAALYLAAPMLRDAVPSLGGFLDGYIGIIDGLRLRLDSLMRTATAAIGGETG